MAASSDMAQPTHQCVYFLCASRLRNVLVEPFPEQSVERPVLRLRERPRLFNQIPFGAKSNVFHTNIVYTKFVLLRDIFWLSR
jgi:hypothetical protein